MKIYEVSYIGSDDLTKHQFFSNKAEATKEQNKLKKFDTNPPGEDEIDEDYRPVKCLFSMVERECEISKAGVLNFLNKHFNESQ